MEHIIWEHGTLNMGIWTTQYGSGDHSNWNGEGGVTIKWITLCGKRAIAEIRNVPMYFHD